MISDIKKILEDAVTAPSGENCQPWKFKVSDNVVSIYNIPEADVSLYNSKQKGSYIAHGALIENTVLSAAAHGYATSVSLFPDAQNNTHIANITFEISQVEVDPLYSYLKERCTNRKDFNGKKINNEHKSKLACSVEGSSTFTIVDDEKLLPALGFALALNERVLFENKHIHDFFYDHIIWDKKDENKAGGFFIDTLEFLPHQLKAVKLFKHWIILSVLNKILGVSKMISKENGEKYSASGSFGAVHMDGETKEDYVNVGRSVQRIWLTSTSLGIAMHPCNGTIYFMEHWKDSGGKEFSKNHKELIKQSYEVILNSFNVKDSKIVFIFRMGYADKPSAQATRLAPSIVFTD